MHPSNYEPDLIRYNIDEVKSLNDPSMPFNEQRIEILALARLKYPEEKLLIRESLERLKKVISSSVTVAQDSDEFTWEKLGFQNEDTP